jgi:hypothetical protein
MARRTLVIPDQESITPTTPLRLEVAAALAFPGGGMTASGLRKEHVKGNLVFERIANKDFVTLHAIQEMRERCAKPSPRDSNFARRDPKNDSLPCGSSEIEAGRSAQARVRASLQRLKKPSRITSSTPTPDHPSATVLPIPRKSE